MQALIKVLLVTSATGLFLTKRMSSTFKSLPHHPSFEEAKNVCMKITDPCSTKLGKQADDDSNKFMADKLHLQPMPADFKGTVLNSALMITRSKDLKFDKHHTAFQQNSEEWSDSMIPMFEFARNLHQRVGKEVFSAVLMPQVPSAQHFLDHKSFDADTLDALLETAGSNGHTQKLFCEDVKRHQVTDGMVCFNRIIHYRNGHSKAEHPHLTSAVAAEALRKHAAVKETKSSGRQAVLIARKDHMGWTNYLEIETKLRQVLSEKCWSLKTVEPSDAPVQHAIDSLKDADLVLANHGGHNEHMIWMPRGAAFIEDKNCKCSSYGYEQLAKQEGLMYSMTAGQGGDARECMMQLHGQGICTKDKPRVANFEKDILPTVENTIEMLEKSRSTPSKCRKD